MANTTVNRTACKLRCRLPPRCALRQQVTFNVMHKLEKPARIAALDLNGVQIMNTQLLQQARVLAIDEQIELATVFSRYDVLTSSRFYISMSHF